METLIGHPLLPADCVDSNGKYTQQRHDMILALHTSTHGYFTLLTFFLGKDIGEQAILEGYISDIGSTVSIPDPPPNPRVFQ